jgi:hypothetical protein
MNLVNHETPGAAASRQPQPKTIQPRITRIRADEQSRIQMAQSARIRVIRGVSYFLQFEICAPREETDG